MFRDNLLFVDDDEIWRRIGSTSFKRLANEVHVVSNYVEGMKRIKKKRYDLIILDGLEGRCFQIIDEIKNKKISQGEIILFSGDYKVEQGAKMCYPKNSSQG